MKQEPPQAIQRVIDRLKLREQEERQKARDAQIRADAYLEARMQVEDSLQVCLDRKEFKPPSKKWTSPDLYSLLLIAMPFIMVGLHVFVKQTWGDAILYAYAHPYQDGACYYPNLASNKMEFYEN